MLHTITGILERRYRQEGRSEADAAEAADAFAVTLAKFARVLISSGGGAPVDPAEAERRLKVMRSFGWSLWSYALAEVTRGALSGVSLPSSAIDIGCGDGSTFWHAFGRGIEYGADVYPGAVEKIRSIGCYRSAPGIDQTGRVNLPDGSVDAVVSLNTLYHAGNRAASLREFARLLRPGGVVIVNDMSPACPRPEERVVFRLLREGGMHDLAQRLAARRSNVYGNRQVDAPGTTLRACTDTITTVGLQIVSVQPYFALPLFTRLSVLNDALFCVRPKDRKAMVAAGHESDAEFVAFLDGNMVDLIEDVDISARAGGAFDMFILRKG